MAKQRDQEERQVTRKETVRRRRDVEMNRRVMLGLLVVGVLLLAILAAGLAQELYFKPHQPIATVNGANISQQAFQQQVRYSWLQQGGQVQDPVGSSEQVLDQMVDEELIRQEAQRRGITVSQQEIDTAIEEGFGYQRNTPTPAPSPSPAPTATPQPSPTPGGPATATPAPTSTPFPTSTPVTLEGFQTSYKNYLSTLQQQAGMDEVAFRRVVESGLLARKLYDQVTADVPKTEEMVHVEHILVAIRTPEPTPAPTATGQPGPTPLPTGAPTPAPTPTPLPPRDDAQALARIIEVKQKLGAGEDFAKLAKEYSDDTGSAQNGGDVGWVGKDSGMVKEFEDAALKLQPGQISDPVKTQYGYHIIKALERDPNHEIDPYTLQQRQYQAYQAWLDQARSQAQITRNWSADKVPPTPLPAGQ